MKVKNPFNLVFGKEPSQIISRTIQSEEIIGAFCDDDPSQQIYMITGMRGSGKTVFLTNISKKLRKNKDWVIIELNPEKDLLEGLAAKLSSENELASIFKKAKINLSFFGLGFEIDGTTPITDIETAISKMLESIKKKNKRVLITIDEVSGTKDMKIFASAFQIFIRHDLPLFLLMAGLYENIDELQNEKNLTFLYRAPKMILKPLNIGTVAAQYSKVFDIDEKESLHMAKLTKGYPFAFQVLGYFTWEHDGKWNDALVEYTQYLEDYVYEKIWSELSKGDKHIAYGIASSESGKISDIRNFLGIGTNEFNPYRKRLIKKGIVNGDERGYVYFTLPMFEKYVLENYSEAEGF